MRFNRWMVVAALLSAQGVELNWHLNRNVKASVNYINTDFQGGSRTKGEVRAQDEEAILARVQLSF